MGGPMSGLRERPLLAAVMDQKAMDDQRNSVSAPSNRAGRLTTQTQPISVKHPSILLSHGIAVPLAAPPISVKMDDGGHWAAATFCGIAAPTKAAKSRAAMRRRPMW